MPATRKTHSPLLKAKVALEAIKGDRTVTEIAQIYRVHPNLVTKWKRQAVESLPEVFQPQSGVPAALDREKEELYRQIGQMKVELDFLKKTAGLLG